MAKRKFSDVKIGDMEPDEQLQEQPEPAAAEAADKEIAPDPGPVYPWLPEAVTMAEKWGIPAVCLESIAFAVDGHTSVTWPGVAQCVSNHRGERLAAFDTLGQTLTRIAPFSGMTSVLVGGGSFDAWARAVSAGISPDTGFSSRMITYNTNKEG